MNDRKWVPLSDGVFVNARGYALYLVWGWNHALGTDVWYELRSPEGSLLVEYGTLEEAFEDTKYLILPGRKKAETLQTSEGA